jgi:hypothetical protein
VIFSLSKIKIGGCYDFVINILLFLCFHLLIVEKSFLTDMLVMLIQADNMMIFEGGNDTAIIEDHNLLVLLSRQ